MLRVAITMLIGDRSKFLGIVFGLAFASLLITQQAAVFRGVMVLTFGHVTDTPQVQMWIADPELPNLDTTEPIPERELDNVRSLPGIAWATPLNRRLLPARTSSRVIEPCMVMGVDDSTLIGAPVGENLLEGSIDGLRTRYGIIVDEHSAQGKLQVRDPEGGMRPLRVGDRLAIGDKDLDVVGICRSTLSLILYPTVYMRRSLSVELDVVTGKSNNFIIAGLQPGVDAAEACATVERATGLRARTSAEMSDHTYDYFLYKTGIPANFGIAVLLGFVVGAAIAGQTFQQFVADNRRIFATLKAMGMANRRLAGILLVQAVVSAVVGYGLGVGAATLFGWLLRGTDLSFRLEPSLLVLSVVSVLGISIGAALLSLRSILRVDPAMVFRS